MKAYQYEIISINEKERWIYLQADIWDDEEPDSFVYSSNISVGYIIWNNNSLSRRNNQ